MTSFLNTVMGLEVQLTAEQFLIGERSPLTSQFYHIKLVPPPTRLYNRGSSTIFGQFTQISHKEGIQLERTQQI